MSFDLKLVGGDLAISSDGSLATVFNDDKLRQDLIKVVLTPIGSNSLFPWYGSPLSERAIGKVLDKMITNMEITNSIIYSINNLMALQKDQEKSGQYISPSESIRQIVDVNINPDSFDARQLNVTMTVASRRANVVQESFKLRT